MSYSPKFTIEGQGDSKPLRDNMIKSVIRAAQRNRAINRRVEIFLERGKRRRPNRKPKPDPKTDWEAFLNTKLRQLGDYLDSHRPLDRDRVHACIRRKLLRPRVDDTVVEPIGPRGAYEPPDKGPCVPEVNLRDVLIRDLKTGYARGPIRKFDRRFDFHVQTVTLGVTDLGFRATGLESYDRGISQTWRRITRWSESTNHIYSCRFYRELIERINSENPF